MPNPPPSASVLQSRLFSHRRLLNSRPMPSYTRADRVAQYLIEREKEQAELERLASEEMQGSEEEVRAVREGVERAGRIVKGFREGRKGGW